MACVCSIAAAKALSRLSMAVYCSAVPQLCSMNCAQGAKSIEFLADPTGGEIRVAANEYIIAGLIATVFGRLQQQYPGIAIDVAPVAVISEQHRALRERKVDLVVGRVGQSHEDDIDTEVLFSDCITVVAGLANPWSRRRKIHLSELADEPWALPPADTPVGVLVAELFGARGLKFAPRGMARGSVHLVCSLVASGAFLALCPIPFCALAQIFRRSRFCP